MKRCESLVKQLFCLIVDVLRRREMQDGRANNHISQESLTLRRVSFPYLSPFSVMGRKTK